MTFIKHLGQTTVAVFLASLALGLVMAALLLIAKGVEGTISLELDRGDAIWFAIGIPIILTVLAVITSPLSYLLQRLFSRLWGTRKHAGTGE